MFTTRVADLVCGAVAASRGRRRRPAVFLAAVAAIMLAVVGCGSSGTANKSSNTQPYGSPPASPTGAATGQTIKTASVGNLGKVLIDGQGRTVYLFEKDKGGTSSCDGACAGVWPPVATSAKPQAGTGANAAKLGTTKRSDGSVQVTYGGHPLYYYAPDGNTPGSAEGEGLNQFGAGWFVLSASGDKVEPKGGGS